MFDFGLSMGANHAITSVVVKLNPDPAWGTRTQNFQILGRGQSSSTFTNLVSAATYTFTQGTNTVTIPVSATAPEIFKQFSTSVVKIEVVETGSAAKAAIGTGFFVNGRGRIITNYHVVSKLIHSPDRYRIDVTDESGGTTQATVLGVDVVLAHNGTLARFDEMRFDLLDHVDATFRTRSGVGQTPAP